MTMIEATAAVLLLVILGVVFVSMVTPLFSGLKKILLSILGFAKEAGTYLPKGDKIDRNLDAERFFPYEMRHKMMKEVGYRCEGTSEDGTRCEYRGHDLHGDHWFPYSKGGATSIYNLVMLCPHCNISKSNKMPTSRQTEALMYRRANNIGGYGHVPSIVGQWIQQPHDNIY